MRELVKDKRRLHEMYFKTESEYDKNEHKRKNREVKHKIKEQKCMMD